MSNNTWLIINQFLKFDQRENSRLFHCNFVGMEMRRKQLGLDRPYHNVPTLFTRPTVDTKLTIFQRAVLQTTVLCLFDCYYCSA